MKRKKREDKGRESRTFIYLFSPGLHSGVMYWPSDDAPIHSRNDALFPARPANVNPRYGCFLFYTRQGNRRSQSFLFRAVLIARFTLPEWLYWLLSDAGGAMDGFIR